MVKQYLLRYITSKWNNKVFTKHKFIESGFDVRVFANSKVEAVSLDKRELRNSICYSYIDNFTLCDISIIE